jgi:hypothetical protein
VFSVKIIKHEKADSKMINSDWTFLILMLDEFLTLSQFPQTILTYIFQNLGFTHAKFQLCSMITETLIVYTGLDYMNNANGQSNDSNAILADDSHLPEKKLLMFLAKALTKPKGLRSER